MSLNVYSENLGYNDYPTQFKEAPEITLSYLNELENRKKNITYKDSNDVKLSIKKNPMLILDEKNPDFTSNKGSNLSNNKNFTKLNISS